MKKNNYNKKVSILKNYSISDNPMKSNQLHKYEKLRLSYFQELPLHYQNLSVM